jgi:F0F1-type ATP synthase membrane subunit c/vacuolar-type H+-ATPase subunit K
MFIGYRVGVGLGVIVLVGCGVGEGVMVGDSVAGAVGDEVARDG